jgi:fatty acid desaturase/cytochrome b involved in lipid metabolism
MTYSKELHAISRTYTDNVKAEIKESDDISTNANGPIKIDLSSRLHVYIHGIWYDMTDFNHPGGPVAMNLGKGRDASVLFESSHLTTSSNVLIPLLKKYMVSQETQEQLMKLYPSIGNVSKYHSFDFSSSPYHPRSLLNTGKPSPVDPFEAEVKEIAIEYFSEIAKKNNISIRSASKTSLERWIHVIILTICFLASLPLLLSGSYIAAPFVGTVTWLWMVNYWHDAAHFAMSTNWLVNFALTYSSPWFSSPLMWYHQHVIGHHAYTNIEASDPDLYHAPKFWRFTNSLRWNKLHRYQYLTTPILWLLSVPTLLLVKPFVTLSSGLYNRAVVLMDLHPFRIFLHILGRIGVFMSLYAWAWFVYPNDYITALYFSFVPIATFSLWFMACSQVNHHAEEISHGRHSNWYRHQVMTSQTIAPDSLLAFFLSGGLNLQIEHHLFPCVNQWHLRQLQPMIEAAAKKHKVPYCKANTISEAFYRLWKHLVVMGEKPSD